MIQATLQFGVALEAEWLLFCLALIILCWPILLHFRQLQRWRWVVLALLFSSLLAAGAWNRARAKGIQAKRELRRMIPREETFSGYVSSDKCRACHPDQYESWHASFHRTMTQPAGLESIQADFDNVSLQLDGQTYRLEKRGDEFWTEMVDPDWLHDQAKVGSELGNRARPGQVDPPPRSWKRIGLVTGSHHFQAFWVPSSRPGNLQFAFPFAWLVDEKRWVPRRDTFLRDHTRPLVQIWNMNCIQCHATAGQPNQQTSSSLISSRVAEMGIACESCHGPAEKHVARHQSMVARYLFHHTDGPDDSIVNPSRLDSKKSSDVCGQCHGVKWTAEYQQWLQHGSTFRPGQDLDQSTAVVLPRRFASESRIPDALKRDEEFLRTLFWPDGVVRVAGREYNGMVETKCFQQGALSCLSCHSMHQSDPDDQLAARMAGNDACLQCHTGIRDQLAQHTHHSPESSGSQCYNCHMPHTTYGLLKAIRSHWIESPNVRATIESGRPNACNLCHLDQTLAWTARHLSDWYRQPAPELNADQQSTAAALLWSLQGDAAQRALLAWHLGWEPARRTAGESWLAPFLIELMDDSYSAVRSIAIRSLRQLPGFERLDFDFVTPQDQRRLGQQRAMEIWRREHKGKLEHVGPRVLLDENGEPQQEAIDRLLRERDNRPVELVE